ncbi:MAG: NIPSNAP family protein [Bryobacteraceae bacterium]
MAATNLPAAGDSKARTQFYTLQNFYLKQGTQLGRLHEYLSQSLLPAMNQVHDGPRIVLDALVATHMPQVMVVTGYRCIEEYEEVEKKLRQNTDLAKGFAKWESGAEAPYEHYAVTLLAATEYSPEIVALAEAPKSPRIFELRVYHSPTQRQLALLHERFAGPEIKIFHRVGVHPLFYTQTVFGPNMPNLTYLIPFADLAAREKAWNTFGADPEWIKVRQESIERGGQISSVQQMSLFRAAPYSPIK